MIEIVSRIFVGLFGLWMMGVSIWIFTAPSGALAILQKMGSTNTIHFTELGLRLCVGLAMIGLAPFTEYTKALQICGWFLAATALFIVPIPHRFHNRYAVWWAEKIPSWSLRFMAPLSFAAGVLSLRAAI